MSNLLEGLRVIEATSYAAASWAGAILADLGAEVIHLEHTDHGDPLRGVIGGLGITPAPGKLTPQAFDVLWEFENRNKRSLSLRLSHPQGQEVVHRLVRTADVFLTNILPSKRAELGVDYATLAALSPRLIYASLTGYGDRGPLRDRTAFDHTAFWARSGLMHALVEGRGDLPWLRLATGDHMAGAILAGAIGFALFHRERTGQGQQVEVSLYHVGLAAMAIDLETVWAYGAYMPQGPREHPRDPLYNYYRCADQKWLLVSMARSQAYWPAFCRALGRPQLQDDPRFAHPEGRTANSKVLVELLDHIFATRPRDEWGRIFDEHDVVWAPVQTPEEAAQDPQLFANELCYQVRHPAAGALPVLKPPFLFSETPSRYHRAAPGLGQDTDAILQEIGYGPEEVAMLRQQGMVH
ncbi:MAG: CoA transferase [Chloroflexi bacterium]|nr:CoA transferase [Chloroflexota bacterium]